MRIASMLSEDAVRLSCEVFPPKNFEGLHQAEEAVKKIAALHPAFMSVTYGAAGSTANHTLHLASVVQACGVEPLCHMTCVQSSRDQVTQLLSTMQDIGVRNVLALRGDLPQEGDPAGIFPMRRS